MRTDHVNREDLGHLLAALTKPNQIAMNVSLVTGLRISDVLALRSDTLRDSKDGRFSVREQKTGKLRRVRIPAQLLRDCLSIAGKLFVFEHRTDWRKHRTRQAVYKDLKRIATMFRLRVPSGSRRLVVAPHSARKVWAVEQFHKDGDLKRVQRLLGHSSEAVTAIYAMADELTARRRSK